MEKIQLNSVISNKGRRHQKTDTEEKKKKEKQAVFRVCKQNICDTYFLIKLKFWVLTLVPI